MNDLIRREDALDAIYDVVTTVSVCATAEEARIRTETRQRCAEAVKDVPAVDAVEVVRCKDCDFYMEAPWGGDMMCYNGLAEGFEFTAPDDYCSRGRRGDGGEKDE